MRGWSEEVEVVRVRGGVQEVEWGDGVGVQRM